MTPLEFSIVFSLGLASGLHCVQMCGPVVLAYSVSLRRGALAAHAAYNGGRIATYMLLGAVAGAAGRAIGLLGRLAGVASAARIVAGASMIVAGLLLARVLPAAGLVTIQKAGVTARFSRAIAGLLTGPRAASKFALGLMLGLLPCGLVYAALFKAVETSEALAGALTMLAFGMGTSVSLLAVGVGSSFLGLRLGRWGNRVAALGMLVFGAVLLWRGLAGRAVCHG